MAKINSKAKGARGERDLCKWWKEWTGYEFSRVPASGGLRWKKTDNITSDVICTDEKHSRRFPLSIECKNYNGISFNDILKGNKSDVLKFWEQAKGDADRGKKLPILFMRENGMHKGVYFVVVNEIMGEWICSRVNAIPYFRISLDQGKIYVFNSDTLKELEYPRFYKYFKKIAKTL